MFTASNQPKQPLFLQNDHFIFLLKKKNGTRLSVPIQWSSVALLVCFFHCFFLFYFFIVIMFWLLAGPSGSLQGLLSTNLLISLFPLWLKHGAVPAFFFSSPPPPPSKSTSRVLMWKKSVSLLITVTQVFCAVFFLYMRKRDMGGGVSWNSTRGKLFQSRLFFIALLHFRCYQQIRCMIQGDSSNGSSVYRAARTSPGPDLTGREYFTACVWNNIRTCL